MTDFKRTYTLVDISERLGRPRTTLADWARQFKEFLPTIGSGRTMRYNEAALEVFGLISKMKDANEPPEYIKEQLRGVVTEIIVPMTDDDEGKPYLMQLAGEVVQLKEALGMMYQQLQQQSLQIEALTTENAELRLDLAKDRQEAISSNHELRREVLEARYEASAATNQLSQQMTTGHDELRRELTEGHKQIAATVAANISEERSRQTAERLAEKRIERQLRAEASKAWSAKPDPERMKKVGMFKKEENVQAREDFIRNYVDDRIEQRIQEASE
ncbi:MerR-like DNA binding protein [Paenibacillus taihuensis]|uniref:MerR-like DNA binding protein n=1 Tax=Paenibacillus taihuensis TaxID=1156355 RepID=A0A3D9PWI4_9BACL|nr:MerR family transcriptional regulator [Paenibacillus taihuensis]REE54711.1 MerR-like DNA binding protein [Paenibacillus taihuensis]